MRVEQSFPPLRSPWLVAVVAALLVAIVLFLGHHSFHSTEKATLDECNRRQLVLAHEAAGAIERYFETMAADFREREAG